MISTSLSVFSIIQLTLKHLICKILLYILKEEHNVSLKLGSKSSSSNYLHNHQRSSGTCLFGMEQTNALFSNLIYPIIKVIHVYTSVVYHFLYNKYKTKRNYFIHGYAEIYNAYRKFNCYINVFPHAVSILFVQTISNIPYDVNTIVAFRCPLKNV